LRPARDHLRVLYLQPCVRLGGAERRAATAIPWLPRSNIEVVPVVGPTPLLCRWLEAQGVRGTILSREFPAAWPDGTGPNFGRLRRYLRSLLSLADQVESIVRDGDIDLVVAGGPAAWVSASQAGRRLGVPVVWRADGSTLSLIPAAALRLWSALAPPDLLVYDSEAARAQAPVAGVPGLVVPAGVDLELFRPGRLDPADSGPVLGFAGRLARPARPEDFVRVAARLSARHPGASFLMAGEGPRRAGLERLARDLGLERSLRFLGFVPDLPAFYRSCDLVVHPSYDPGCANGLLEPMAAARAVVAGEGPATVAMMTPGRHGLVCPAGDVDAFAESASTLLEIPSLRRSLATAARERIRQHFDARRCTARLAQVLHHLAARSDASSGAEALVLSSSAVLGS
jgi:glycosyltransferase involved in cell wall biosynthesis